MHKSAPEIRPSICPVCKKPPTIQSEFKPKGELGLSFFVACKCKEGVRGNSGATAIEKWNAGHFVG